MRTRSLAAICFVALTTVALLEACVSDAPDTSGGSDASSGSDSTTSSDGNAPGDSSTSDSAIADAGPTFDGANAYCNDLFPGSAPQAATVECPDGSVGFPAVGGSILAERYYLFDQDENSPACGAAGSLDGYHDAVRIDIDDAGTYVVNAAIDGADARRLTLTFSNFTTTTFTLTQTCPSDGGSVASVPYTFSNDGAFAVLQYKLPGGNFGIYTFRTY